MHSATGSKKKWNRSSKDCRIKGYFVGHSSCVCAKVDRGDVGLMRLTPSMMVSTWLVAAVLLPATAHARSATTVTSVSRLGSERPEEISFTITARVDGVGPEQLSRCIARSDRRLRRDVDSRRTFTGVRWTEGEDQALRGCSASGCKYEFDATGRRRLGQAGSLGQRKALYYQLVREATLRANKKRKDHRIRGHQVARGVGGRCVRHGGFHWLLDGRVKSHDKLVWRKINASSRMRPTMTTMQVYQWRAGQSVCLGKSLLFSDHYYDDHLELFEMRPGRQGQVELQYHVRSRFDFFGSWWARRFKGTIASRLTAHSKRELVKLVNRCASRQLVAKRTR